MANSERLLRLLRVVSLVDRKCGAAMGELLEHCEVSERTVFRDVEALNEAGLPIYFDEARRRYFFSERVFLKPLTFSADEASALLRAIDALNIDGLPFGNDLELARNKVLSCLPEVYREQAGLGADAVDIEIRSRSPVRQSLFKSLEDAVRKGMRLTIEYESLSGSFMERLLDPFAVTLRDGRWYLIAFCYKNNEVRMFRVDRIATARENGEKFSRPADFSLDDYFAGCLNVVRGDMLNVRLLFSPDAARWAIEECYHKQQNVELLEDGSLLLEAPFYDNWELHSLIMGLGRNVEVLAPDVLRQKIVAELEENLRCYQK